MAHRLSRFFKNKMLPKHLKISLLIIGLVILPSKIYAQSIEDCLMCHSDNELTMEKGERQFPCSLMKIFIRNQFTLN